MGKIGVYVLPFIMAFTVGYGLFKKVDVFECFIEGAKEGLKSSVNILPSLMGLITAVTMLKVSGALDVILYFLKPVSDFLGIPGAVMPLALLRPVSGGGALAVYEGILSSYGPDSSVGRIASVMMGSSETTFYCTSLYFGSIGVKKTRHAIPAALLADLTCFAVSIIVVNSTL